MYTIVCWTVALERTEATCMNLKGSVGRQSSLPAAILQLVRQTISDNTVWNAVVIKVNNTCKY
eukprot:m.110014 g.110014  ORF g.110014 m.110014 type:complete len:63 (-) comp16968_c0_seq1:229-417(-)